MAEEADRSALDPTAGLPRPDRHPPPPGSARSAVVLQAVLWGLGCGVAGGTVAGTLFVPLFGTAYGAVYGLAIAVLPSVFGAAAIVAGAGPSRSKEEYVRRVRTVTAGLGVAVVVVGIPVARTYDDGFGGRSSSWLTTAVAFGLLVSLGVLVRATRSLTRLDPPRPAEHGALTWAVLGVSGTAIAVIVGALVWSHLLTGDAQQRNDAIGLRNRAGELTGIDRFPESSRRVETIDEPVEGCPPGPISRAQQVGDFIGDPTERLDQAATTFASDGWGVVRGVDFVRSEWWTYAERRDRSVLLAYSKGINSFVVTATVGCPDGVPDGSTFAFPGGPAPLGASVRRDPAAPVLVPVGEEIPGRDEQPALVSAARVPEERVENRGYDECTPQDYPTPGDQLADAGDDRIVVVVAHEVDPLRAPADDWVVVRRSGKVVKPTCIRAELGDGLPWGIGLPSTMLLAGRFDAADDPIDRIELRSPLATFDPDVGSGYEGLSIGEIAAIDDQARPVLAIAQPLPGVDPERVSPTCRDAQQTLWVLWDREVLIAYDAEEAGAGFHLVVEGSDEPVDVALEVGPDEIHELCVPSAGAITSVTLDAGAVEGVDNAVTFALDDVAN